ncbi:hypothetical protein K458DRAFT_384953 [Lentithecium fluviatile CBS 122367]|uniref:Uncharacterized protein n=1 Tax=Lentithecium fluviatile CBS 122367 TaxID=1168545 RepID=A0A6G1JDZ2_9PLEO|nr:hypothetical protein K458DRAFT_384953 [Lentithecium fluviatile CBS 122367]
MIPAAQLLTAPTSPASYKPDHLSYSARSLISSSFIFLQVDRDLTHEDEQRMAQTPPRPWSRNTANDGELWFNMASSARRDPDATPYEATSRRHAPSRSISPSRYPQIPLISTSEAKNKPLPPSPGAEKKRRTPASLRNLIRRHPSGEQDSTHLQPEPYQNHQRSSSASNGKLSPEPYQYNTRQSSRSMPSSPLEYTSTQPHPPSYPPIIARSRSAASHYADMPQYQAYSPPSQAPWEQRSVSMGSSFESPPLRGSSTFPETTTHTATPRSSVSNRPRPHTSWLSPTEPFQDPSEVGLFAAATCGLPGGFDPLSPSETPRLQGSLFARGRQNDSIPFLTQPPRHQQASGWQPMPNEYIPRQTSNEVTFSSSALPSPPLSSPRQPSMNRINLELERLGLADEEHADDELPNYAQSQAQMSELKRREAAARARELEARWNSSRGWRSR